MFLFVDLYFHGERDFHISLVMHGITIAEFDSMIKLCIPVQKLLLKPPGEAGMSASTAIPITSI